MVLKNGLERRFVSMVFVVTTIYVVFTGLLAYKTESQRVQQEAIALREQLINTVLTQAEIAAFAKNADIADEIIHGLLSAPYILGVDIRSFDGFRQQMSKATLPAKRAMLLKEYALTSPLDKREHIGVLSLTINQNAIEDKAAKSAKTYALLAALQSCVLSGIFIIVVRIIFSRPFSALVKQMSDIRIGDQTRVQVENTNVNDEIGLLSQGINQLIDTGEQAFRELTRQKTLRKRRANPKPDFLAPPVMIYASPCMRWICI